MLETLRGRICFIRNMKREEEEAAVRSQWKEEEKGVDEEGSATWKQRLVDTQRKLWAKDGIHPNDEGYRIWGEYIGSYILRQALLQAPVAGAAAAAAVSASES